jgi:NAD(P)-dependent dehydrogenase (short-subunit alcohol dehydrogenase family)
MAQRTKRIWFITGVSSGFGRQLTEQLLERGAASLAPFATPARSLTCSRGNLKLSSLRC